MGVRIAPADAALISDACDTALASVDDGTARGADLHRLAVAAVHGGKMIRPALVLGAHDGVSHDGARPPALLAIAAAFELLHASFLVHDDIIDRDLERRGQLNTRGTLQARLAAQGTRAASASHIADAGALLVGDLLLYAATRTFAMGVASAPEDSRAMLWQLFDRAVAASAAGEWGDAVNSIGDPDQDDIWQTTAQKTAMYTFTAPLQAGAVLGGASPSIVTALASIGANVGLAFQLVDDLIGTIGDHRASGRAAGSDLREHKRTTVTEAARSGVHGAEVTAVLTGPIRTATDVDAAQRVIRESGAVAVITERAQALLTSARSEAEPLPAPLVAVIDAITTDIVRSIP